MEFTLWHQIWKTFQRITNKEKWLFSDEKDWLEPITDFAIKQMLSLIKHDLDSLGIKHDIFISEKRIVKEGKVNKAVKNFEGSVINTSIQ